MRRSLRLSFALPLTLALSACPGDDSTTTTSGGSSTGSTGAADSTTAAPGTDASTAATGNDSTGPSDTTTASTGSSTSAMETTDGMVTESSGGASSTGGSGVCPPEDGASIGVDCEPGGAPCPECYTCQPFEGIVFQQQCQILCEDMSDCPPGLSCVMVVDKTGMPWQQCQA